MKCIMRPIHLRDGTPAVECYRVSNKIAHELVHTGAWSYANKELWKVQGRKYLRGRRLTDERARNKRGNA